MKTKLLTICLLILLNGCSQQETVDNDDLVIQDGLIYKKFTSSPFTGKVSGTVQSSVKNGKLHGDYIEYFNLTKENPRRNANGTIFIKTSYKNGEIDGDYEKYQCRTTIKSYCDRILRKKYTVRNGIYIGEFIMNYQHGGLLKKKNCLNGLLEGHWLQKWTNGKIMMDFNCKKGFCKGTDVGVSAEYNFSKGGECYEEK